MANQYGINLAQALSDAESIKGHRNVNALNSMKLAEAKRLEEGRPAREAAALARKNKLAGLRSQAVGGDEMAAKQLLALDPEGAPKFLDALSRMDESQVAATKQTVDEIGQLSAYVLNGKTPEEQNRRYQMVLQGASQDMVSRMPKEYSPQFMEYSLSKAMTMDKLLEAPTVKQVGGEDVVYSRGKEIERAARPQRSTRAGLGGGIKSGDESLMYRQAVELLGGIMDEQGNIRALDATIRPKVQAIAQEAAKLFAKEGNISRSEAVTRAAKKFGVEVAKEAVKDATDPDNIRAFLKK